MTGFVNPYSFVPLPKRIERTSPSGHERRSAGLVSGELIVDARCETPLLIRGFGESGAVAQPPQRGDGRIFIPGSSIHGALRSLHETMSGGCLRVFDEDFVPVYRMQARAPEGLRLAVVQPDRADGTVRVALCDDVVYVDWRVFGDSPDKLRSGARLNLVQVVHQLDDRGRRVARPDGATVTFAVGGDRVVLVTDTRARRASHPCYFATGRVGTQIAKVSSDVLAEFTALVKQADDLRPGSSRARDARRPDQIAVTWGPPAGRVIGYRDAASDTLRPGQVLWARVDAGAIAGLALAQIWRERGSVSAGERIPETLAACTDPADLCTSCRVFGSADTRASGDDEAAAQSSYRGHVRVLDSTDVEAVDSDQVFDLPPLGQPRPGSGQFYLRNSNQQPSSGRPARQWGRDPDRPHARHIRGRKMYWSTGWNARQAQADGGAAMVDNNLVSRARPLGVGSTFSIRVVFENLWPSELGAVIACLDLSRWATAATRAGSSHDMHPSSLRFPLGGGKPLGFGALDTQVRSLRVTRTPEARWLASGGGEESADPDALVAEFVAATSPKVRATWLALSHLLSKDFVAGELVQYPPAVKGNAFHFWSNSIGVKFTNRPDIPLRVLPAAEAPADRQTLSGEG